MNEEIRWHELPVWAHVLFYLSIVVVGLAAMPLIEAGAVRIVVAGATLVMAVALIIAWYTRTKLGQNPERANMRFRFGALALVAGFAAGVFDLVPDTVSNNNYALAALGAVLAMILLLRWQRTASIRGPEEKTERQ
jgi:hypothetical protein